MAGDWTVDFVPSLRACMCWASICSPTSYFTHRSPLCASCVSAAASHAGYEVDEHAEAEEECSIPSIVVLEIMASVLITVLMYHTDVKESGGAATSSRRRSSQLSTQNDSQRKVSVSVQAHSSKVEGEKVPLTPSMGKK